jgi:outer membrane immunogenic protein
MKIKSSIVIAAAAGSALAPGVADAQSNRASPVYSWTGFYVGAHLGGAWQDNRTTGTYVDGLTLFPFTNDTSSTGFIGGGQIGYNWQTGVAVFGIEADWSSLSSSGTKSQNPNPPFDITVTSRNEIEWLGTIRGRAGALVTNNTLLYATGGFAFGRVNNFHSEIAGPAFGNLSASWQEQTTRHGYVVGGGIEHMFAPNWTARLEGLFVDLGSETVSSTAGSTCVVGCFPATFTNQATIARAAINFRF